MAISRTRVGGGYVPLSARYFMDDAMLEAGLDAELLWVRGCAFSAGQLADGFMSHRQVESIVGMSMVDVDDRAKTLVRAGLWVPDNDRGGYRVRNWLKFNRSADDIASMLAADAARKTYGSSRNGSRVQTPENGRPHGVQPESDRNPVGVQPESDRIPHGLRDASDRSDDDTPTDPYDTPFYPDDPPGFRSDSGRIPVGFQASDTDTDTDTDTESDRNSVPKSDSSGTRALASAAREPEKPKDEVKYTTEGRAAGIEACRSAVQAGKVAKANKARRRVAPEPAAVESTDVES